jgi:hypothetical protein
MKKNLLMGCAILVSTYSISQENTVSTGGDGTGSGGTFSYSIGQIDYHNTSGTLNISEGVQQPHEYYSQVGLTDLNNVATSIYPNPASEEIIIELNSYQTSLEYDLYDAKGKLVKRNSIMGLKTIVPIQELSSGTYILEISDGKQPTTTLKFIKY